MIQLARELLHLIRSALAVWLLERAVDIAPKDESNLYLQAFYLVAQALKDGDLNLRPTVFVTKKKEVA